jgi:sulfonate transport system permease protein
VSMTLGLRGRPAPPVNGEIGDSRAGKRRRLVPNVSGPIVRVAGPVLLLIGWAIGSATGVIDDDTLPSPFTVVRTAITMETTGQLWPNLWTSAARALTGLGIGLALGLFLALAAGLSRTGLALIDGSVQIWRSVPILAIVPLAVVWLGIGEEMKITIIALAVMVPIYINTAAALASVDQRYVELAETLRLSRREFIQRVALPGAVPGFLTGLRLAAVSCWLVLVVVEQTNARDGIGYVMANARTYGQIDVIAVGLVLYAVLGVSSDTIVRVLERRALVWRKTLG